MILCLMSCRYHGPQGFPGRGTDHEEVAAPKVDPAVCSVHHGGANIHHHRTHEEWQLAGVPAGFVLLMFSSYFVFESTYDIDIVSAFRASYTVSVVLHVFFFIKKKKKIRTRWV